MTETFLSRWSRLKSEPKPEPAPPEPPLAEETEVVELPPLESLTKDSDFSPFLRPGVPEAIKQAALSRLWASDPLFSKPEIYDLHMEDYGFPSIPEVVKTAWKVGKGVMDAVDEVEAALPEENKEGS